MRNIDTWRRSFATMLEGEYRPIGDQPTVSTLLEVELSLYLLETVAPGQSADGVPSLLDGYLTLWDAVDDVPDDSNVRLANARIVLHRVLRPFGWESVLRRYRSVPEHVRAYDFTELGVPTPRTCRIAPDRRTLFEEILTQPLPFDASTPKVAEPGSYRMASTARGIGITLPEDLPSFPDSEAHETNVRQRSPIKVSWSDLVATARTMDATDHRLGLTNCWADRIQETTLQLRDGEDRFEDAAVLTVDAMLHMVGLVSVGKTTLLVVLSVWAAQNGHTVTIVVGDNSAALRATRDLSRYDGVRAAPVLGTNRTRHTERLHRLQPPLNGQTLPDPRFGFELVSTACAIDTLRRDAAAPLAVREAPCQDLVAHDDQDPAPRWRDKPKRVCPLWHGCQRHEASRQLVGANVWIATPWSMVHTRLPAPLASGRMRYLEAIWRRSDLVIVDEADQVQANLDEMFASAQVLLGSSEEAWIDEIAARVEERLRMSGRAQNSSQEVRSFTLSGQHAKTAAAIIYQVLQRDRAVPNRPVLNSIEQDYFTAWSLFDQLAQEWAGHSLEHGGGHGSRPAEGWENDPVYIELQTAFNDFIDEPTGEQEGIAAGLVQLVEHQLSNSEEEPREDRLRAWLEALGDHAVAAAPGRRIAVPDIDEAVRRLELALAIAVMAHRLNVLLAQWPQVAAELDMHDSLTAELRRPPTDLVSLVPDSPMGNVLGFQYVEDDHDRGGGLGEFRFFRYSGVGRMLLVGFPDLFPADGPGPNVLLLSGTSWAGTSPRYNIDVPVGAILRPSAEKLNEIGRTRFALDIQTHGERSNPIWVSGRYGPERAEDLRLMVKAMTRPGPGPRGHCRLERERAGLDPARGKILLLVGSYAEARLVAESLLRSKPSWAGQIRCLVGDDELESGWEDTHLLRRGDVSTFGRDDAWILVAPILAVERGHNILNSDGVAAIGAAFFMVRPHPRPRDLSYVTQRINQYAQQQMRHGQARAGEPHRRLTTAGTARRRAAQREWRRLLHLRVAYSQLGTDERRRVAWTQLVTIWQVVGRLLRGGQSARIYFCDAAFAPAAATRDTALVDTAATSLLHGMREVLDPYFRPGSDDPDRYLVQAFYQPLHNALTAMEGTR